MSIIPCITWVRRGKAKSRPDKLQIEKEDLKRIIDETQERLAEDEAEDSESEEIENTIPESTDMSQVKSEKDDGDLTEDVDLEVEVSKARAFAEKVTKQKIKQEVTEDDDKADVDLEVAKARVFAEKIKKQRKQDVKEEDEEGPSSDDFDARYQMSDYDREQSDWSDPFKGIGNLTVYPSNDDDPFVLKDEEADSDEEDFQIKSTDNLMLVARADGELCSVEVHVYNSELENLYVHHDILLSTFPLALEWMDYDLRNGAVGNFVAIATMDPTIDIWDLDLVESLEPLATLGEKVSKKKKKGQHIGHTDAVLDLSWNPLARHVLASASADFTIGLWDLTEGRIVMCLKQHKEKVQCVKWHPVEEHMLLSGSFDKTVKLYDCRSPDSNHKSWQMNGEIEKVLWNTFAPLNFFASTDTGHVYYLDSRQDKPVYTLSAHTESVTGLCMSSEDSRLLVTSSTDKTVKVWDIEGNRPSLVLSQDIKLGPLHSMGGCPDAPYVFAIGGEKSVKVWDLRDNKDVFQHFCDGGSEMQKDKNDTEETSVAMETEVTEAIATVKGKKKKKKKKKKPMDT